MNFQKLKSQKEFDLIYKKGRLMHGNFFAVCFFIQSNKDEPARFAVVISAKVSKKATQRNRKKRQMREILRLSSPSFAKGFLFLVIMKDKCLEAKYRDLEEEFLVIGKRILRRIIGWQKALSTKERLWILIIWLTG